MNTTTNNSFDEAIILLNQGQFDQAKSTLEQIILAEPSHIEAYSKLGLIAANRGDAEAAISSWQKATSIDPGHFESLSNLGYIYTQIQQPEKALPYLERAYQLNPEREEVALQIAQIHFQSGAIDTSEKIIEPLLREEPIIPNAFLLLAEIKASRGLLEAAEGLLNELISKAPHIHQPHLYLARLYASTNKLEQANQSFEKALSIGPQFIETTVEFARFLVNQGQIEKGTSLVNKLYKENQNNLMVVAEIATLYESFGNFEKALEAFDQAVKLAPDNKDLNKRRSQIYTRFVPPWHMEMLSDITRNEAFQKAIEEVVDNDSVVLDIGTGSGILSMMAARAGAKKVYTCESSKHIAKAAKDIIQLNGFDQEIQLFERLSSQIQPSELDQKPNVIVAEIFDAGLLGEHALLSFRQALDHLATPNCAVIPKAANVKGRLITMPNQYQIHPMKNISGFDLSPFNRFRDPQAYTSMRLSNFSHEFLSAETDLLQVNFEKPWDTIPVNGSKKVTIEFEVTNNGEIHGIAFWFNLFLTDHIQLSSEDRKDNHWGQAVTTFDEPIQAKKGETLAVTLCYNDVLIWFEQPSIFK